MGYDPFSPISLARINLLCIPANRVTAAKFDEYVSAINVFSVISLRNTVIESTANSDDSSFAEYKDGSVLLSISKDVYIAESTAAQSDKVDSRPQILLGLVDGEGLAPDQSLEMLAQSFKQHASSYGDVNVSSLVVLGGRQLPVSDDSYFVDLDGDGPSLFDVMSQIVTKFQLKLGEIASTLQGPSPGVSTSEHDRTSTPANNTQRGLEGGRPQSTTANGLSSGLGSNSPQPTQTKNKSVMVAVSLGHLSLQAGQWPQALRYLSEGATDARDLGHHLLQAKALEGLLECMLLFAWARLDFNIPQVCYPTNTKKGPVYNSPSTSALVTTNRAASDTLASGRAVSSAHTLALLIPHLVNTIISLSERAAHAAEERVTFCFLCQSRLRWANLLIIIKKHGSILQDSTLAELVEGYDAGPDGKSKAVTAAALTLHSRTLTKMITESALEAQARLSTRQSAQIQVAAALSLSMLGVDRKQAFHLREFLQKLGPALIEARRAGAAEMGIHPAAGLPPIAGIDGKSNDSSRSSIRALLDSFCASYGISPMKTDARQGQTGPSEQLKHSLRIWLEGHSTGDVMMKIDVLSLCIEVSDAMPDLQCSLDLISQLLQISVGKVTLESHTTNDAPIIPANDQSRLILNLQKAVNAAERYGISGVRAEYWDKCLVRAVEILEDTNSSNLMRRTTQDLSLASAATSETKKDPFIFNPFAKTKASVGQSVIVVGEQTRFSVLLQNPLQIEIEIEDVFLLAEGCDFQPDHHSVVLGPLCSQAFTLSGRAQTGGDLAITGCRATVRGCYPADFLIVQGAWKMARTMKQAVTTVKAETLQDVIMPDIKKVSLQAINPLPTLILASTSMIQPSLMLIEGESTEVRLMLRNDSDSDIDFVHFTFQDSVTKRLEEALNHKDLAPVDLYEMQNQIATRPVARLKKTDGVASALHIGTKTALEVVIEVFGRAGLTEVLVLIDYTHLGKPIDEVSDSFYTRQLRQTITTTVNGSIDIPRCSILPLDTSLLNTYTDSISENDQKNRLFSSLGNTPERRNQCMLLLDVRNIWPHPLDVQFEARQAVEEADPSWNDVYTVTETLQPGQMARVLLLAPRILVLDSYAPIPSLDTKRQFVVSASKTTIEAEAASRESFWYRERLLKCLRASWKEQDTDRAGQLEMRKGIRLSARMIDALRIDLVEVTFSLRCRSTEVEQQQASQDTVVQTGDSHFRLARNTFATLLVRVKNHSNEELRLLLRMQPSLRNQPHNVALDLSKRFVCSGTLQRAIHPPLEAGATRDIELDVIALAEGDYKVNGTVEEIKSRSAGTGIATLQLGNGNERRIWHARKPCFIDALDGSED